MVFILPRSNIRHKRKLKCLDNVSKLQISLTGVIFKLRIAAVRYSSGVNTLKNRGCKDFRRLLLKIIKRSRLYVRQPKLAI